MECSVLINGATGAGKRFEELGDSNFAAVPEKWGPVKVFRDAGNAICVGTFMARIAKTSL